MATAWATGRVDAEAKEIVRLVDLGVETVESARRLIDVPEDLREQWNACDDPWLHKHLMGAARFLEEVLECFNSIIAQRGAVAA